MLPRLRGAFSGMLIMGSIAAQMLEMNSPLLDVSDVNGTDAVLFLLQSIVDLYQS